MTERVTMSKSLFVGGMLTIAAILLLCANALATPKKKDKEEMCKPSIYFLNPNNAPSMDFTCPSEGKWAMTVIPRVEYIAVVCECPGGIHTVSYMGIE